MQKLAADIPKGDVALHFPYADAFRALAIFGVFLGHLAVLSPTLSHHVNLAVFLIPFDGVVMLFVLSGYLLSGPFIKSYLREGSDFPIVRTYFAARLLRIYPLYLTAIAALAIYEALRHTPPSVWDVLSHTLFLQNTSIATTQSISGPLWTMAVDAEFYVALPLLFWYLFRATRTADVSQRVTALFVTLGLICVSSMAYRYLATIAFRPTTLESGIVFIRQLPGMLCVFTAGIAARAYVETATATPNERLARSIGILVVVALCFQPVDFLIHQGRLHELLLGRIRIGAALWSVEDFISAVPCVLLIVAASARRASLFSRILSSRIFTFAAALSYAFYLFHLPVIEFFAGHDPRIGWATFIKTGVLSLIVLLPLTFVLHRFIENPFLNRKSKLRRSKASHASDLSDVRNLGAAVVDVRLFPGTSEQA